MEPVRFVVFGDGEVGNRITRYAKELPNFLKQIGYVEVVPGQDRDVTNELGIPLYAGNKEAFDKMRKVGNNPAGTLEELSQVPFDVAIDATDRQFYFLGKVPNFQINVPIIGQGSLSEGDGVDVSISSLVNLHQASGYKRIRKVSCNTTGGSRVIKTFDERYGLGTDKDGNNYLITLFRRTTNFGQNGLVNNVSFGTDPKTQHHAHDIDMVFSDLARGSGNGLYKPTHGKSFAYMGPHTRGHVQHIQIFLNEIPREGHELEEIYALIKQTPRMALLIGVNDIAGAINHYGKKGRFMDDFPENAIIKESIQYNAGSNSVELTQIIDNVSIVVPENLDILLMLNGFMDTGEVIRTVDEALSFKLIPGFVKNSAKYTDTYRLSRVDRERAPL